MHQSITHGNHEVCLTIGLGNTLDFVLLLDGVGVGRSSGSIYNLVGQALGDGLNVSKAGLAGASGHEVDGVVDAAEGRHIHSLSSNNTGRADTSRVLTRAYTTTQQHND